MVHLVFPPAARRDVGRIKPKLLDGGVHVLSDSGLDGFAVRCNCTIGDALQVGMPHAAGHMRHSREV
jgi:hypothetical protein